LLEKTSFSNYGTQTDVSAPGLEILSLAFGTNGFRRMSGTSMACPHVAGLVGLMLAVKGELTFSEVKALLIHNVDPHSSGNGVYFGKGRVNANKVLGQLVPTEPEPDATHKIIDHTIRVDKANGKAAIVLKLEDSNYKTVDFDDLSETYAMARILNVYKCDIDSADRITCRT